MLSPVPGAGGDADPGARCRFRWRCGAAVAVPVRGLAGPGPPGSSPAPCGYNGPGRRRAGSRSAASPAAAGMAQPRRAPALAMVALLVLATVVADEPTSTLDVALSAEGQTPEPVSPAKLEASGESDLTTSAQRLGKGLTPLALEGAERSPPEDSRGESLGSDSSSLDPLNSGSFSADASAGEARGGPIVDVPAQSNESEEGMDRDPDSEEALASQASPSPGI